MPYAAIFEPVGPSGFYLDVLEYRFPYPFGQGSRNKSANEDQLDSSTFSLKPTSFSTMQHSLLARACLTSFGKNTPFLIPDI
jgi:hypothetical protein